MAQDSVQETQPKDIKTELNIYVNNNVHTNILHNSQRQKQSKFPSTDEWIHKMSQINAMEYYSDVKKEWSVDTCYSRDEH